MRLNGKPGMLNPDPDYVSTRMSYVNRKLPPVISNPCYVKHFFFSRLTSERNPGFRSTQTGVKWGVSDHVLPRLPAPTFCRAGNGLQKNI